MSIPTLAPASLGDDVPAELVIHTLGLADVYDADRDGTPLDVLQARLAVMRHHANQAGPDFAIYLSGYADALHDLHRLQEATTSAQISIAFEDQENHR
jgi:hypothetical protein